MQAFAYNCDHTYTRTDSLSLHPRARACMHPTENGAGYREKTFLAEFELGPGEIYNEWVMLEMPTGKIAIEAFNADIVVSFREGGVVGCMNV